MPSVDAIIATMCEAKRWASLIQAIQSLQSQDGALVNVIVVVNGDRSDPACLEKLKVLPGVQVYYQAEGNLARALCAGRSLVRAEYFCFLDDDDEYLPGAMHKRLAPMLADPGIDFVATNGFRCTDGDDRMIYSPDSCDCAQREPLLALSRANWLASCGGMFRSRAVTTAYFEHGAKYFEWTVLAYRLASALRPAFLSDVTFRINDTAGSMSKTNGQHNAEVAALRSVLALQLPTAVRRSVREKLGRASHAQSSASLDRGDISAAWRHHLASLTASGGWKYLLYTRKLVLFSLRGRLLGARSHTATIVPFIGMFIV